MRKITKKREFEISKSECGWDVGESIQFEVGSVQVEYYKRRPIWERKTLERKELKLFGWWWDPAEVLVAVSWSFFFICWFSFWDINIYLLNLKPPPSNVFAPARDCEIVAVRWNDCDASRAGGHDPSPALSGAPPVP